MNKEEIEKAKRVALYETCKECYFPKRKCTSCVRDNRKKIKKYIQNLEQKEKILDKVTEECLKQMTTYEDSILEVFPQKILNIIEGGKK